MQIVYLSSFSPNQSAPVRDGVRPAMEAVRARMQALFGPSDQHDADIEDWYEHAGWLLAAKDSGVPVFWCHGDTVIARLNTQAQAPDPDAPTVFLGHMPRPSLIDRLGLTHVVWPTSANIQAALAYPTNAGFLAHAGRPCCVGTVFDEGGYDPTVAGSLMQAVMQVGQTDCMFKVITQAKYSNPTRIMFDDPTHPTSIRNALVDALGWDLVHTHGIPSFLVQGYVPMRAEYRLVVVGGQIVSGAGCIEQACPPYRTHSPLDPMVEGQRGDGALVSDPDLVMRYHRFANQVVLDLQRHDPALESFVLDIALGPDHQPLVVEINPATAFGLYANDPHAIVEAILKEAAPRL